MKACKDLCPVHQIQRCCFLCDEQKTSKEVCSEDSNDLCELLVDIPDGDCEQLAEKILEKLETVMVQKKGLEDKEKELKEKEEKEKKENEEKERSNDEEKEKLNETIKTLNEKVHGVP